MSLVALRYGGGASILTSRLVDPHFIVLLMSYFGTKWHLALLYVGIT